MRNKNEVAVIRAKRPKRVIPEKRYQDFGVNRIDQLENDIISLLDRFKKNRYIKSFEKQQQKKQQVGKVVFKVIFQTGEEFLLSCSFLLLPEKGKFASVGDSRVLTLMIDPKRVGLKEFKNRFFEEILKRSAGFKAQKIALDLLQNSLSQGGLLKNVKKGGYSEDFIRKNDILVQSHLNDTVWIGIDIKTNFKRFKAVQEKRKNRLLKNGNPVCTSLAELQKNPEKFIKKVEKIILDYFDQNKERT